MHDEAPKKIHPKNLGDYLEAMSKPVFQAGISWQVVENKWDGINEAFDNFDPAIVSKYTGTKLAKLLEDERVIRNHRKIEAIVYNARRLLELDKQYGDLRKYLRSFKSYDELANDLRKQFKFLGDMGIYHFLYTVGEQVPEWEEWSKKILARKS